MLVLAALIAAPPAFAQSVSPAPAPPAPETPALVSATDMLAFVRARAADAAGAADVAAAGYATALDQAPDDPVIAIRAYREGLAAGDYALAGRAAAALGKAGVAPPDTEVLRFAVALHAGDAAGARDALDRMSHGPLEFMVPVLSAWMAFDRGEDAVAQLEANPGTPLSRRYAAEHRALLLIAAHRPAEGLIALQSLLAIEQDADMRIDAALLLAGTGEADRARAMLSGPQAQLISPRASLGAGVKPSAAFGASRLFLGLASDLSREDMGPVSILLARAALLLDPGNDRARLYLAQALSRSGSKALALHELTGIGADSPFARSAGAGAIDALRRAGETGQAIDLARAMAAGPSTTVADIRTYGDLLAEDGQYAAAAAAYGDALRRAGSDGDWQLHFQRGTALDRAGSWKPALTELRRAAALAPQEPDVLNTLGYALLEHNEDLAGAQALIERASTLKPQDSSIADSLAWAYYRRGDIARALPLLERAAQADPGGAQVNEHLGDAYWRVGRRYEARYAWRAAAVGADESAARRIEAKLVNGLTGAD